MRAVRLHRAGASPDLRFEEIAAPEPAPGELLLTVRACALCRTDLHVVDGELPDPRLPLVLGHQIVGVVAKLGAGANRFHVGDRVGVPWLARACGTCGFCRAGEENLCDVPLFTGYTKDGGFAEACVADQRFVFPIPPGLSDTQAAPLLCGGLIGYRALRLALATAGGDPERTRRLGFYGFGSSAHLLAQIAIAEGREIYAFTRAGDRRAQELARRLGALWAGGSDEAAPAPLDAALIFAPVGALVPRALRAVRKGGAVVCAGIHMSDIPSFPYELLWGERSLRSVANLTRRDGEELLPLAARLGLAPAVELFPLARTADALDALRSGRIAGSAVLLP